MKQYKKNLILIILMSFFISAYAEDFAVLNGAWKNEFFYDYMANNPQAYADYQNDNRRFYPDLEIRIRSDGTGYYQEDGMRGFDISRVEQRSENEFVLYFSADIPAADISAAEVYAEAYITVIDEDSFCIASLVSKIICKQVSMQRRWRSFLGHRVKPLPN